MLEANTATILGLFTDKRETSKFKTEQQLKTLLNQDQLPLKVAQQGDLVRVASTAVLVDISLELRQEELDRLEVPLGDGDAEQSFGSGKSRDVGIGFHVGGEKLGQDLVS